MKINFKKWIPYLTFILVLLFCIQLTDESTTPIEIYAKNMTKSAGSIENVSVVIDEGSGYVGNLLKSNGYMLKKGVYTLGVSYNTTSDENTLDLFDNGRSLGTYNLDPNVSYAEYTFELEHDCMNFQFNIDFSGTGILRVYTASLIPEKPFYYDTTFAIVIITLCSLLFAIWRIRNNKNPESVKNDYVICILIGIGLLASLPYLKTGLSWAIDLCYHLIRIEGIKDGLLTGQFPVVIFPEALSGNGYLNCMYPNTFLYIPAFLRILGVSMADSFKFFIMLFHFATAFITYHCIKTIASDRKAALLAALLYTCCPYRFTNLYARGAIGEFLAMTFLPLIFAGLYHILIGDRKKWGYLVIGMTGLLQTHILSVTLAGIFCVIFGVLYFKEVLLEKRYIEVIKAAVCSVLLNIGFLVPFLSFYKNENLWMDALDLGTYQEYTLNLSGLMGTTTTGDYHVLTLGIPIAVCAAIAFIYLLLEKKHEKSDNYIMCLFVLGAILTFMMLNYYPGWRMMEIPVVETISKKIQFAWRLLGPVSFLFAAGGSICLFRSKIMKEYSKVILIVLSIVCLMSITRFYDEDFAYYSDRPYTVGHESKIIGIPKGENTVVYPYEWRLRNTGDKDIATALALSDSTMINLIDWNRTGTTTVITYSCHDENQYIELPVQFYRGYAAASDTNDDVRMETGRNNRIRVYLKSDNKPHEITVRYKSPIAFTISAWISILTAVLLACKYIFSSLHINIFKEIKTLKRERNS